MTETFIELTEQQFHERFPLRPNHINPAAGWSKDNAGGCLFEIYGPELAYIGRQNPSTVWTLLEADDGELYIVNGIHHMNHVGYLISLVPAPTEVAIRVHIPMDRRIENCVPLSGQL